MLPCRGPVVLAVNGTNVTSISHCLGLVHHKAPDSTAQAQCQKAQTFGFAHIAEGMVSNVKRKSKKKKTFCTKVKLFLFLHLL